MKKHVLFYSIHNIGVKWVPELLDHNTKEWQLLANEVSREVIHYCMTHNKKYYKFQTLYS